MSQGRLCSLAMLSIECQLTGKLDFKDLINDFAAGRPADGVNQVKHELVQTGKWQGYDN